MQPLRSEIRFVTRLGLVEALDEPHKALIPYHFQKSCSLEVALKFSEIDQGLSVAPLQHLKEAVSRPRLSNWSNTPMTDPAMRTSI
jgi:hypothetical protein